MIATRLGPYLITAKLGEGGMGEVYRATDARLEREVAIKVLPAGFTEDPERLERFEREARLLAQLHHPHIASIFGLEEEDGVLALVMELVEGDDLSVLIARGALPLADALPIARQIAEALEAAHEQGIVHRDLKPANIKVCADGTVKVLDFGLAKAMDPVGGPPPDIENSPTLTARATRLGVILGTAAYMAPEQARGKPVDRRADIWAFGVVVWEMLTGRRLFASSDVSDVLAAVLRQEIDWSALPRETPWRLRRLLERCLERVARERLRDIGEARVEIAKIESGAPDTASMPLATATARRGPWRERIVWLFGGIAAAAALAVVLGLSGKLDQGFENRVVRLAFVPPAGVVMDEGIYDYTVVSPDGRNLVFTGRLAGGRRQLWLRAIDSLEARVLPGTDEAIEPFWSPDSRSVGFGADGKLKRVEIAGGTARTLVDAPRLVGGAWNPADIIVFAPDYGSGLLRVPATGGAAAPASTRTLPPGEGQSLPRFLPDGQRYLYRVVAGAQASVVVGRLGSDEVTPLLAEVGSGGARYAPPGWLLFVRDDQLVAQAFDAASLKLSGEPLRVPSGLAGGTDLAARFSVSDNGVLVLQHPRDLQYQLLWLDRSGREVGEVGAPSKVSQGQSPELSPDGRQLAIQRADAKARNTDLWVIDLARGAFRRLTSDPVFDQLPVWASDGRSLFFTRQNLRRLALDGSADELLLSGPNYPKSVSPDGRFLVYVRRGEATRADIWVLPLTGERTPVPLLRSEFDDDQPQFSPDGRWLAYSSDVTGRREIYVRPFVAAGDGRPALGEATLVSAQGGMLPRWRHDGGELFYIEAPVSTSEGVLVAVPVRTRGGSAGSDARQSLGALQFDFDTGVPLFDTTMVPNASSPEYAVALDGQKFVVGTVVGRAETPPVSLVLNWTADLLR